MKLFAMLKLYTSWLTLAFLLIPSVSFATAIISDPIGDAGNWYPDITSVSGSYDSNNLYLKASFVPGTLNPSSFSLAFYLDTDQNLNTFTFFGNQFYAGLPTFPGADYIVSYTTSYVDLVYDWSTGFFQFGGIVNSSESIQGPNGTLSGSLFQIQLFPDAVIFSVPLSLLGNDDGIDSFGAVSSGAGCIGPLATLACGDIYASDYFGDVATGHKLSFFLDPFIYTTIYPLSGPTTPVPEPNLIALFAIGTFALFRVRRPFRPAVN